MAGKMYVAFHGLTPIVAKKMAEYYLRLAKDDAKNSLDIGGE